ncbi:MAG: lysine--tRNA ligase [Desulfobacteraceae bacterium]|nr:MAG: lysine--tRNA ligase [Desulfobacteraceae bacterium]
MEKTSELLEKRRIKLSELRDKNINLFPNDYIVLHTVKDIKSAVKEFPESKTDDETVYSVAGRMMAINLFGKSSFIRFIDRTGQFQAYIRKDRVGDDAYALFKQLDIGDFVGIRGSLFKTKTGEWTILAIELRIVCKAIRPLPEKFHGLKDPEKRYRQRYLDLIMNPEIREIFIRRSKIIQVIRSFFLGRDYIEAETPMMQPIPGGAEATPFQTHHKALGMDLFLRIAPELYLKRLVVGGFERVFEINRNFRNEGISTQHNPEFTMLEFYEAYATYQDLMNLTEDLFSRLSLEITGSTSIVYQGNNIEFSCKWRRISLLKALEEVGGIDPLLLNEKDKLLDFANSNGINITKRNRTGKIITKLFDVLVQPKLIQPTFVTDYPVEVSPLSRRSEKDPNLTDRFELFIAGREIANGFSELNDPEDQKARFVQQVLDRQAGDDESHYMDEDYIEALEYGMPPAAGEGIGIDRLTMLFTDAASIREVILFPHMKPQLQRQG